MTLQNRVTPFGQIIAVSDRGDFMGNRGQLHNTDRQLVRVRESRKDWVACALSYKNVQRTVMAPNRYTELFFLDEATALAAGHRPCAECRRAAFDRIKASWSNAGLLPDGAKCTVKLIDPVMHTDRMDRAKRQVTFRAELSSLPDGTMVELDTVPAVAWLVQRAELLRWSPAGYTDAVQRIPTIVSVLTPASTVRVLRAGYVPEIHHTAANVQ